MPNVPDSPRIVTVELLNVLFPDWSVTLDPQFRVWVAERRDPSRFLVAVDLDRLAAKIDAAEAACTCDHGYLHREGGCTYPGCGCTFWAGP